MIGEAVDVLVTLGWALAAWIAVAAVVVTVVVLGVAAAVRRAVHTLWRALAGCRSHEQAALAPSFTPDPVHAPRVHWTPPHPRGET